MQKKWIVLVVIIFLVLTAFVGWRLSLNPNNAKEECLTATKPKMIVPIEVFEGTPFVVQVCNVESNHIYQLRENDKITSFTGETHYFIPLASPVNLEKGFYKIVLWDNTTQTIIDEKMIVLIQMGGIPCDFLVMLAIPIIIILIIVGAVVKLGGRLKK